jgi:hypothetical protein
MAKEALAAYRAFAEAGRAAERLGERGTTELLREAIAVAIDSEG